MCAQKLAVSPRESDDCCDHRNDEAPNQQQDPRVSLFLKRHFSVAWERKKISSSSRSNCLTVGITTSISLERNKSQKKFEKLVSTRRSPEAIYQSDQFWSCCESDFERLQEELSVTSPKSNDDDDIIISLLWNTSSALKALRSRIYSNEAQHIFKPSDFVLLKKLGKGGWGSVYKAIHIPTGHLVALKEINHHHNGSSDIELKEQRTLPLDCGVVPCYGTFKAISTSAITTTTTTNNKHKKEDDEEEHTAMAVVADTRPTKTTPKPTTLKTWMILKLCSEGSLADRLVNNGVLTTRQAAHILKRVSTTLCYLHTHHGGIIHNDLKPANILLHNNNNNNGGASSSFEIYVCDLGVARRGLWQSERLGGTYSHMSPEKLTARKLNSGRYLNDEKIDVWALGVMLYEMLFLSHPYHFEALAQCPTLRRKDMSSTTKTTIFTGLNSSDPDNTGTTATTNNDDEQHASKYIITTITARTKTPRKIMDLMEETYETFFEFPNNKHAIALERRSSSDQLLLLKDLLERLLNVDFLERIPLSSIKKHPWVKQQQGFSFGGDTGGGFGNVGRWNNHNKWTDHALSQLKMIINNKNNQNRNKNNNSDEPRDDPKTLNSSSSSSNNNNNKKRAVAEASAVKMIGEPTTTQLVGSTQSTIDASSQRLQVPSPNHEVEC